jgi:hypothetical protein
LHWFSSTSVLSLCCGFVFEVPQIHLLRSYRVVFTSDSPPPFVSLDIHCSASLYISSVGPHVDFHLCAFPSCSVRCGVEVTATSDSRPRFCSLPPPAPGPLLIHLPVRVASRSLDLFDKQTFSQERCQEQVPECDESSHFIDKNQNPNTPRPHRAALTELCADCRIAAGRAVRRVTWRGHRIRESPQDIPRSD